MTMPTLHLDSAAAQHADQQARAFMSAPAETPINQPALDALAEAPAEARQFSPHTNQHE